MFSEFPRHMYIRVCGCAAMSMTESVTVSTPSKVWAETEEEFYCKGFLWQAIGTVICLV